MLRIGEFSKLTQVSIRMLRHYDELGLLKPSQVDGSTGYRYYSAEQLPHLNRILALQDLGFSLAQIGQQLRQNISPEQLRGMLTLKQAELEAKLMDEQARLARVEARLKALEGADPALNYDVVLKEVGEQWVAAKRDQIQHYHHIGFLFDPIFAHLAHHNLAGLTGAIWHDDSYLDEGPIDAEAFVCLSQPIPASDAVQVYPMAGHLMASLVHHGPLQTITFAYSALVTWMDQAGYQMAGPNRELYIHYTLPANPADPTYVTELQFPVERRPLSEIYLAGE